MRILIKYTLKSMMEKKFRAFLIVFAIALACGLFLASSRLSSSITDMYYEKITAMYGDADIDIYTNEDSPTYYISLGGCKKVEDKCKRIIPQGYAGAEYKPAGVEGTQYIQIQAYNIEDYLAINKLAVLEGDPLKCKEADLILSEHGMTQLGLSVGDEINLRVNGSMHKVKIVAKVGAEGIFKNESQSGYITGIMPFDTIAKYNKTNNRASEIHIDVKDGVDIDETIAELKEIYPKYTVERTVNIVEIQNQLSSITMPFMMMTFIVVFMSVFIIYSSFKVIMLEKLPAVGTFRSIGADKWVMNGVLLLEALFYGIIGGIVGCLLGIGCLYVLSNIMVTQMMGESGGITLNIPAGSYFLAFFMGVVMAILSTLVPILSVSKISLKDIILNNRPHKKRKYLQGVIIGVVLVIGGFILAMAIEGKIAIVTSMVGMFMVIIGIIKILPSIVLSLSIGLGGVFRVVFGNLGELATKNIKKNKSVLNSISLITIGISILFAISTMTQNVNEQTLDFFKDTFLCDIRGYVGNLDDQKVRIIKRNPNVENVIPVIQLSAKVEELDNMEIWPEAIRDTQLSPDIKYNLMGDEHELLEELQEGRNILLSKFIKSKYKIKEGDYITLSLKKGKKQYKVIGFMDTLWQGGSFALVPYKYIKRDLGKNTFDLAYISVKDGVSPDQVAQELDQELQQITWTYMMTIQAITESNQESNAALMTMISIFAILAMVIGVVGVVNNLMISFIERKQHIAMMRSVGMSKAQVLKMIFIEGVGSGVIGGLCGLVGGVLVTEIMNYVLRALDQVITMKVVPELFLSYFIGGMLITVIGSIIPARGSSKLNIIEAIKYE